MLFQCKKSKLETKKKRKMLDSAGQSLSRMHPRQRSNLKQSHKSPQDLQSLIVQARQDPQRSHHKEIRVLWTRKHSLNSGIPALNLARKVLALRIPVLQRQNRRTLVSLEQWLNKEMVHKKLKSKQQSLCLLARLNSKQATMKKSTLVKIMTTQA